MRKFTLFVAFIAIAFSVDAQDLIVLRNATEIQSKVLSITPESVTYKRWSNLEGPAYTIPKSEVFYIKYQNGEKDVMQEMVASQYSTQTGNLAPKANIVKFQGYITAGATFGDVEVVFYEYIPYLDSTFYCVDNMFMAGPTFNLSLGVKIYDHLYMGVESGFHSMIRKCKFAYGDRVMNETLLLGYVPIGVNVKGYFTKGMRVNPFINCSLGGFIGVSDLDGVNGFSCQVGAGFEAGRFLMSAGYSCLKKNAYVQHAGYVQLGVRLGK